MENLNEIAASKTYIQSKLKQHVQTASQEKTKDYVCEICNMKFGDKVITFHHHMRVVHSNRSETVKRASTFGFLNQEQFEREVQNQKITHQMETESQNATGTFTVIQQFEDDGLYMCDTCNIAFTSTVDHEIHNQCVHSA